MTDPEAAAWEATMEGSETVGTKEENSNLHTKEQTVDSNDTHTENYHGDPGENTEPAESENATEVESNSARDTVTSDDNLSPRPLSATKPSESDANTNLLTRLGCLTERLDTEDQRLKQHHFKEYAFLSDLKVTVKDAKEMYAQVEKITHDLSDQLASARKSMAQIKATIDKKLLDEGLLSWLENAQPAAKDKEAEAEEKALLAKAAEVREGAAKANVDIATAVELAARLEAEVLETAVQAKQAAEEAEAAARAAEEARKAAEAKARAEEEARRKKEEEERRKAAEEKRKREEEEKRKAQLAKLAESPEEQERLRQEAERKDPKNWPTMVYSVDPSDIDIPVGMVLRAMPGTLQREDIICERLEQLDGGFQLSDNEELVSHILRIAPSKEASEIQFEEPLAVAIPHCAPRNNPTRVCVIKMLQPDGQWQEVQTMEAVFEDIKEFKFVETRLKKFGTLAVVTRFKREQFTTTRKGGKISPAVDPRVCFNIKPSMFKSTTTLTLEIQPVELSAVSDLKTRKADDCAPLLASSPIIMLTIANKKFNKSITVTIPVPPNPTKLKRPGTAAPSEKTTRSYDRPKSAIGPVRKRDGADDELHLLAHQNGQWSVVPEKELTQAKNKDVVSFEMETPIDKFLILRMKAETTVPDVEKIAQLLETSIKQRIINFILRQRSEEPSDVTMQCTSLSKSERIQRKLLEEGFDAGPNLSQDIVVAEGQTMFVRFRGNIKDVDEQDMKIVYNSHIKNRLDFTVAEIDRFAQKSIDCYRGFAQVFTRGLVPKSVPVDAERKDTGRSSQQKIPMKTVWVAGDVLLCELLISLPKPEQEPSRPTSRAPVTFKSDGLVDDQLLRNIAAELGDEWRRLASYLNVRKVRIQAILRNNVDKDQEATAYDMLVTWAKKAPRSLNKVDVLTQALLNCGRGDLVEDIRDRENDFKRERAQSCRDAYLRKAFIKVAQDVKLVNDWKLLARRIGLLETDIIDIENDFPSMRDRCFQSLLKWRQQNPEGATVDSLAKHLKKCKYNTVAAQVSNVV